MQSGEACRDVRRRHVLRFGAIGFAWFAIGAASRQAGAQNMGYLDLVITYAGSTQLSPEARLTVDLYDETVSADRAVIQKSFVLDDTIPVTVQLPYPMQVIDPAHRYTLSARIEDRGRLWFRTSRRLPVLTYDAPSVLTVIMTAAQ